MAVIASLLDLLGFLLVPSRFRLALSWSNLAYLAASLSLIGPLLLSSGLSCALLGNASNALWAVLSRHPCSHMLCLVYFCDTHAFIRFPGYTFAIMMPLWPLSLLSLPNLLPFGLSLATSCFKLVSFVITFCHVGLTWCHLGSIRLPLGAIWRYLCLT